MFYFFRRVKRLIEWVPVIWKSYDFDHCYPLKTFEYHLSRLENCMENGHHLHAHRDIKRIRVMRNLLKRISSEQYVDWNYIESSGDFWERGTYKVWDTFKVFPFKKITPDSFKYEEKQYQQDVELFCKYFKKYYRNFWD